ncbi:PIN domain-containing protein [Reyranella sp.]|uniref:PIN domain-containing protein n=1 Tax=Reyranella sp. TaxID=1929291 RepID=UPI003BAB0BB1
MPAFLDSNVLVYAFTTDRRSSVALDLLRARPVISVQGLNEFANVARRKLGMTWPEVRESLSVLRSLCHAILSLDAAAHDVALRIAERYGYSIFDALVVASALQAGSETLWSEDMQHGLVVDGRLRIANPFRSGS